MTGSTSVVIAIITWSRKFSDRGGIKFFFYQTFPVQACSHIHPFPWELSFTFKCVHLRFLEMTAASWR